MQFLEASAEMIRWLIAHVPSRKKHPSVALPGQNIAGYLLQSQQTGRDFKAIPSDDREFF